MPIPVGPINPLTAGAQVGGASPSGAGGSSGGGFAKMLESSLGKLNDAQVQAAQQTQALATGQAQDLSTVVTSVEQASLEVQLASQIRNKVVDAYNDIFRMQI